MALLVIGIPLSWLAGLKMGLHFGQKAGRLAVLREIGKLRPRA